MSSRSPVTIILSKDVQRKLRQIRDETGTPMSQILERSFCKVYVDDVNER